MRHPLAALLGASAALLFPTAALAENAARCSSAEPRCERASLAVSKAEKAPFDFDFDTGWVPGGSPVQVRVVAKLHSRVGVSMEGTLDATWPEPLTLTPKGEPGRGRLSLDEGLEVEAQGRFSVSVAGVNYSWTGKLPGIPSVNLLAEGSNTFNPWAWKGATPPASITVNTPTTRIARISLTDSFIPIRGISGGFELDGAVDFSATYSTLRIGFDEPSGSTRVDRENPFTRLFISSTPAIDTSVFIHGELVRQATLHFIPAFYFTILGTSFSIPIANLPLALPPSKPEPWDFDKVDVHIPLPQISTPAEVDLGSVPVGAATTVALKVSDVGEELLVVDSASAHPWAFVDTQHATVDRGGTGSVRVVVTPDKEGKFDVPVSLTSNDPLRPVTEVHLRGVAEKKLVPGAGPGDQAAGEEASGCGCRTASRPSESSAPSWAALGLMGFALAFARGRRRR